MIKRSKEAGFTLIELIMVIVILGILAAVALPKFANLTKDATIAKLKGMEGALKSGTQIIYSKALIEDKTDGEDSININGTTILIYDGYPTGNWFYSTRYVINQDNVVWSNATDVCDKEWCGRGNQTVIPSGVTTQAGKIVKIYPEGYSWSDQCAVYYVNHENGTEPETGLETADC